METMCFDFRIIDTECGNQIIDRCFRTPYSTLTPIQMVEYLEMDNRLAYMDRMKRKERAEAEHRRKIARNPLSWLVCAYGLHEGVRGKLGRWTLWQSY